MNEELNPFGLGGIESPPDERDWTIDALYAMTGTDTAIAVPASYVVPAPYPTLVSQGSTPMCVAFSAAGEQGYFDLRDQGAVDFDRPSFFAAIGGTSNGAVIRDAFARRLAVGYPTTTGHAELHKIAAYYAVPVTIADIQQAVMAFGPLIAGLPWYNSWFHPVSGVLPAPDYVVGGHALQIVGFDSRGLRFRNSWGTSWGLGGDAYLPWGYLSHVREAWKAVDVIEAAPVPPPTGYHVRIAAGALVKMAVLSTSGCIKGWTYKAWGNTASSAPCKAPVIKRGCSSGSATVAYVTAGTFKGKWLRIGTGVTVS